MVIPLLTVAQKRKRVAWCQAHLDDDWSEYMFTDESYFPFQANAVTLWERPSKSPPEKAQSKFFQKILAQGGVSYYGKTPLKIRPPGTTLNAQGYIDILGEVFPDSATELFGDSDSDWHFIQDNATPHKARITKEWMTENEIPVVEDFPPNSPDINIIESIWGNMKNTMYPPGKTYTQRTLEIACVNTWNNYALDQIRAVIDGLQARIQKCIEVEGRYVKY